MENTLEQQSELVIMSNNRNALEEGGSKSTEVHLCNSNTNHIDTTPKASIPINDRNETWYHDAGNIVEDKKDTEKHSGMDLLLKLGNDPVVYNISNSLERVRYMINSISIGDLLSSRILPYQRCVTYISEVQKTVNGNQKANMFKFVSSYPSSDIVSKKYRVRTGVPIIIIGDITNVQEDQCSYVFICAYMKDFIAQNDKAVKTLDLLGTYSFSADESSDDGSSIAESFEDSSSDCSSSNEDEGENKENSNKIVKQQEYFKPVTVDVRNPLVFLEDGAADKLPPVRECDIKVVKQACIEIGYVMHIHELLVSVQGYKDSPALNADTLLFLEDNEDDKSLRSLGFVYEVIGPVDEPVYCVTFKEEENIEKKQVKQGEPVYIYPSPEHTHFVFVQDLLKQKGSDASWKNDAEPPEQFIEYSDDEEERMAKQRLKQSSSNESSSNAAVKRKNAEENKPEKARVYKRRRTTQKAVVSSHSTEVKVEDGTRSIPSEQPQPRTSGSQHNSVAAYQNTGRGHQVPHAAQVNGEVGTRGMPSVLPHLSPGMSGSQQHNGIGPYKMTGRGQQIPHAAQVNGEVGIRGILSVQPRLPPRMPRSGPYHMTSSSQQMPRAAQMNGAAVQPPRMQQFGFPMQPMSPRPAGISTIQQPPRMQQYAPAVNRHFLPMPPALFPPNQNFTPPLQQQQTYLNSPSFPRCPPPFPSPQGQFYNPPQ